MESIDINQDALHLSSEIFGFEHPTTLTNLAASCYAVHRYEEAENYYNQALSMLRQELPDNHPKLAILLSNMAAAYKDQGKFDEAEEFLKEAVSIAEEKSHPNLNAFRNNLAEMYRIKERYEEASTLMEEAKESAFKNLPLNHPDRVIYCMNRAATYRASGQLTEAESYYRDAVNLANTLLPSTHPHRARVLNNLAVVLVEAKRPQDAFELMEEAADIENDLLHRIFISSSDQDRSQYLKQSRERFEALISVAVQLENVQGAHTSAFNVVLQRKALTTTFLSQQNEAAFSSQDPHEQKRLEELRAVNDQLLDLSLKPLSADTTQKLNELKQRSTQLERELAGQIPALQRQDQNIDVEAIAQALPEGSVLVEFLRFQTVDFRPISEQGDSQVREWRYLAFVLPANSPTELKMINLGDVTEIDQLIRQFRLQTATKLALSLDMRWSEEINESGSPVSSISAVADERYLLLSNELFSKVFEPLLPYFKDSRNLIIAPDGSLNLLPFGLLQSASDRMLFEDGWDISYLSVGRELLQNRLSQRSCSPPVVFANPNFGRGQFQKATGTQLLGETVAERLQAQSYFGEDASIANLVSLSDPPSALLIATHGFYINPQLRQKEYKQVRENSKLLASLQDEGELTRLLEEDSEALTNMLGQLADGLGVMQELIEDSDVMDQQREARMSLIVDILSRPIEEELDILQANNEIVDWQFLELIDVAMGLYPNLSEDLTALSKRAEEIASEKIENPFSTISTIEDPMMRSGIACAGANPWLKALAQSSSDNPSDIADIERGILFARDIAGLNLWGTKLCILSACQTGMGDIVNGEGVFGLRRAFAVAGCKTLITSLWSVPDRATALLFDRFFHHLNEGLGRNQALLSAQKYVREITVRELQNSELGRSVFRELEAIHGSLKKIYSDEFSLEQPESQPLKHPYFWGAWICQGNIEPLSLKPQ